MKTKIVSAIAMFAGTTAIAAAQCGSSCGHKEMTTTITTVANHQAEDIVDVAVGAGQFKTLAAALGAADLVGALKGKGPFTVFAPTDEAFAKLPKGTVETLLKPENKGVLTSILTYHVVSGNLMAKDVLGAGSFTTLNGQRATIEINGNEITIGGQTRARIIKTDITADNGVIHVIDSVILPSDKGIVETASDAGAFNTLLAAAKAAGLVPALTGEGPFTVFAPTDDAFAKLPKGTVETLLKPENKAQLAAILKYHVVPGRVYAADAVAARNAKTLEGSSVNIRINAEGQLMVDNAKIVSTNIDATNGVIHVVDSVILPGN